ARALNSHCDSGPASSPIRLKRYEQFVRTASRAAGSLATFTSRTNLPAPSTMQTLLSLTETSSPAKSSLLRFSLLFVWPHPRTSFDHQPEAQHPKSLAIHNNAGRLPHLLTQSRHSRRVGGCPLLGVKRTFGRRATQVCPTTTIDTIVGRNVERRLVPVRP